MGLIMLAILLLFGLVERLDEKHKLPSWGMGAFFAIFGLPWLLGLLYMPLAMFIGWIHCVWGAIHDPSSIGYILGSIFGGGALAFHIYDVHFSGKYDGVSPRLPPRRSEFGDSRVANVDETYEAGL